VQNEKIGGGEERVERKAQTNGYPEKESIKQAGQLAWFT
jgi:hypothetical protein